MFIAFNPAGHKNAYKGNRLYQEKPLKRDGIFAVEYELVKSDDVFNLAQQSPWYFAVKVEEETLSMADPQVEILGGPTSGHRRHKGIPGYRGGSLPGSGQANVYALRAAAEKGKESFEVIDDNHPRGAYESHRIRIKGNGEVILKPAESLGRGDVELVQNEVAAYEISERLGFGLVPPTTRIENIKNSDGEIVPTPTLPSV